MREKVVALAKKHRSLLIAFLLFVLAFSSVLASQRNQGIARDEVVYMNYGSRYAKWWSELLSGEEGMTSAPKITEYWGGKRATDGNREHPPLMKSLFGFSEKFLHKKLGWTSQRTAYRAPTAAVNALLVALVFLFASQYWGLTAGLLGALLLLFLPRAFFHAGLASFDSPVVFFWFASLVAYLKALRSRWGFLWLGLCVGLCLATKHNAIMLPAVFLPHYVWWIWSRSERELPWPKAFLQSLRHGRLQLWLGVFLIAPMVLISIWPWMWFDTFGHLKEWMAFHFNHVHYNFEYLGSNWNAPPFPWHVALVTTALTVPLGTLVAGLAGFVACAMEGKAGRVHKSGEGPALLLFLSAGVAMGPFLLRSTPIFGAEKHWAPAMPSLCIFAGIFALWWSRRCYEMISHLRPRWNRKVLRWSLSGSLCGLLVVAALAETWHAQPYALSHYNALAGGASGGASLGMNRQFWGYSAKGVLPFVNQFAVQGRKIPVYTHDASPAWGRYAKTGELSPGLPNAGHEGGGIRKSKIAIVVHEKHFSRHDYMIWKAYGKVSPSFVLQYDGVPLVSVYVRDELLEEKSE